MAQAKILTTYTGSGVVQAQGTGSGLTTNPNDVATYFDPLTGQTLSAPNGADLLEVLQDQKIELCSDAGYLRLGQSGKLKVDIRKTDGLEWSELVFDLSSYADPKAAKAVILDALENPNYMTRKNVGNGVFQDVVMQGKRGVIAWPIHQQNGAATHFQCFVHSRTVNENEKRLCPPAVFSNSHIRDGEERFINEKLQAAGLAPISLETPGRAPEQQQAAAAAVKQSIATNQPLQIPVSSVPLDTHSIAAAFQNAADEKAKALAKLVAEVQEQERQVKLLAEAAKAMQSHEVLQTENATLKTDIEKIKEEKAAALKERDEAEELKNKVLEDNIKKTEALEELRAANDGLQVDYSTLFEENETEKAARQAVEGQNVQLQHDNAALQTENATLKTENAELQQQAQQNAQLQQQVTQYQEQMQKMQQDFIEMQKMQREMMEQMRKQTAAMTKTKKPAAKKPAPPKA